MMLYSCTRDVFEDAIVEDKVKARSFRIKATYTPMKSYMIS